MPAQFDFTTSQNYVIPPGYSIMHWTVQGGGGGGASGSNRANDLGGGGGAGGGGAETTDLACAAGDSFSLIVGTGGSGGTSLSHDGNNGTESRITSLGLHATGGNGGLNDSTGLGGAGGLGTGGNNNYNGNPGADTAPTSSRNGGDGGASHPILGLGGAGGTSTHTTGADGGSPGAGGGGGFANRGLGGHGAGGLIRVFLIETPGPTLIAETSVYITTPEDTTRKKTITRTAEGPVYGITDEQSKPTKILHLIPSGPTLYSSTPAATLRAHTHIQSADTVEYSTTPRPTTKLITRNLSAAPAAYTATPRSTTRQKTSTRSAQLCKYHYTARPTAPNVWRKGVRRTLPRPDANNWRSLLLFTGLSVTGDIGPITTYTTAAGKKVFFAKYELDGKIRTPARVACRDRWRAAAAEWQQLTPTERTNWEAVTKKLSLRLTGYNLWMWWATHQDNDSIDTVARQAGIPLLPPSTRP